MPDDTVSVRRGAEITLDLSRKNIRVLVLRIEFVSSGNFRFEN